MTRNLFNTDGYPVPPTREQLEERIAESDAKLGFALDLLKGFQEQNTILVEALKFYAALSSWEFNHHTPYNIQILSQIDESDISLTLQPAGGKRAREALEKAAAK